MGDNEKGDKEWTVEISLPSKTPVVGVEIEPSVCVKYNEKLLNLPPYSLSFTWCREKYQCSVHSSKLATIQCVSCVKLKLPVKASLHCSPDCLSKAWKDHLAHHRLASEDNINASDVDSQGQKTLRTCGSWPSFVDGMLENDSAAATDQEEKQWIKVGCMRRYVPSMGDLRFPLRLECVAIDSLTGRHLSWPDVFVTDPVIVAPPPRPRDMIKLQMIGNLNVDQSSDDTTFTVLTYNILSDLYAWRSSYYCPRWALMWDYRRENLLNEIIGYGADIVCLQEVQSDHFENFFEPQLKKYGYSVSYKKKTKDEMFTINEFVGDGCATFYRHDIFREVTRHELEFDEKASPLVNKIDSTNKSELRLKKGNIALIVVLGKVNKRNLHDAFQHKICVANTHIFADTKFPDVKLFQVSTLMNVLEEIAPPSMPLLICGDMNSLPGSDHHQLITRGKLGSFQVRKKSNPFDICRHLKLEHSFKLESAYASFFHSAGVEEQLNKMDRETSEPLFTCFTARFSGTLDYIFFTEETLRVIGLLELLDRESIGQCLPTPIWSSDHIALMARFKILTSPTSNMSSVPLNPTSKQEHTLIGSQW